LLVTYVDWKGFDGLQEDRVIERVLDGKSPDLWMTGIDVTKSPDHGREQFKKILEEQAVDYQAARLRDTGQDYEKLLKESTDRPMARVQENEKEGRER
jgi:hypothetical protein